MVNIKKFFELIVVFLIFSFFIYFIVSRIINNKDDYQILYDKYSNDSSFECKISKCVSESNVDINGITFSLSKELNVYNRFYSFKFKKDDMKFNGVYNLI